MQRLLDFSIACTKLIDALSFDYRVIDQHALLCGVLTHEVKMGSTHCNAEYRDGAIVNERFYMSDGLSQDLGQATEVPVNSAAPNMVPQEEVDRVVKAVKASANEKIEQMKAQLQQQQSKLPSGVGGGPSRDEIEAMMEAKLQKVLETAGQKAVAQKVMNDFTAKMASGYEKYPDFKDKMQEFGLAEFTDIVQMATNTDNTADVMYELATNPGKLGSILALSGRSQRKAMEAISELSKSIKDNDAAKGLKSREPLSQVKPTATAVDSGNASIRDLMKQPWLRR